MPSRPARSRCRECGRLSLAPGEFRSAVATGHDWRKVARHLLTGLGDVTGGTLGVLYLTDDLVEDAGSILMLIRRMTGIADWVGTVGMGVMGGGQEFFSTPALVAMVGNLPADSFHLLPRYAGQGANTALPPQLEAWVKDRSPTLGLIHADPNTPNIDEAIAALGRETGAFLVGGLSASRGEVIQIAGEAAPGSVSGVLFGQDIPVLTGLSQGCSPIGPVRRITEAEENVVIEIDDRPALDVLKEDIGELLARDLRKIGGYIFAGLPVTGTDTGDYLVRNILGVDQAHGLIAVTEIVERGQPILFTRRDRVTAVEDLDRMLSDVTRRLAGRAPKAAIYTSCVARGPNLFGDASEELSQVHAHLGADTPIVGFFANGEISQDRLYGYTGVLTVFA